MKDIKKLAELIRSLEQEIDTCARCGMCQSVCPIFNVTLHEADVARGKLALLSGLATEMFNNSQKVSNLLNRCLLCGSCENICTRSVNALEIFIKARIILTEFQGLSNTKKLALRHILSNPKRFDRLLLFLAKFQNLFVKQTDDDIQTVTPKLISPLLHHRRIVPLASVPFHKSIPHLKPTLQGHGIKAALFTGCLVDKLFPGIAFSVIKALTHHNVGIVIPDTQGCCGMPALASGDTLSFQHLVEYNLNLFQPETFDYLVTACPTCTFAIKTLWPMMYNADSAEMQSKITEISKKTIDINSFLVTKAGIDFRNSAQGDIKITYHDPCHLKKSLGISKEPRLLLQQTPGYSLTEMPEPDTCCGMGGSFNLEHYSLSMDIGKKKRDLILATGCTAVATSCPACMIQFSDLLAQCGSSVAVKHVIEIYANQLD